MPTIPQTDPAATQQGEAEQGALRTLGTWRQKDRAHLTNKRDRDAQRAEYRARQRLREAADKIDGSGQP